MTPKSSNSSYQQDVLTIDKKIAAVELEIARLQAQVIDMKRTRNSLTPLCRLPSEILVDIILRTQAPELRKFDGGYNPLLYNFEHDQKWEKVTLTCSHIHHMCIVTPYLWTHIDLLWSNTKILRYIARSGVVNLTLYWDPAEYVMPRFPKSREVDAFLTRRCFDRDCAAQISLTSNSEHERAVIMQAVEESAKHFKTLHIDLSNSDYWTWLNPLKIYPALVELSITRGSIHVPMTIHIPLLSRLHLHEVTLDNGLPPLIELLQHTPLLTEVLLCEVVSHKTYERITSLSKHSLNLPALCRMVLIGCPFIIHGLLAALSPLPLLQELLVDADFEYIDPLQDLIYSSLFRQVVMRWGQISKSSLPPAKFVWTTGEEESRLLDIRTPRSVTPALTFRTIYCDNEMPLYRQCGLEFKTICVSQLSPDETSSPWTIMLNEIIDLCAPDIKELALEFSGCYEGVPGIQSWIRKQQSEGRRISRVTFTGTSSWVNDTQTDYESLEKSGLVQEVVWEEPE
jgi:hypothetical protein